MKVDKHITRSLTYFAQYDYAPTLSQLHRSLPNPIDLDLLKDRLDRLTNTGLVKRLINEKRTDLTAHYTLPQYSINASEIAKKWMLAQQLKRSLVTYFSILSNLPFIRAVFITGSMAYESAQRNDDVDLFIVTSRRSIWTARLACILIAECLGIRKKGGVCLNLFFECDNLIIPSKKRTAYVALELLAALPVVDKDGVFTSIRQANSWVYGYYPNSKKTEAQEKGKKKNSTTAVMGQLFNSACKLMQFPLIRHNQTGYIVNDGQLWLFLRDHETTLTIPPPVI